MALKNGSSANLDLNSLITVLKAFEKQNGAEIVLSGQLVDGAQGLDLEWKATAWDTDPANTGAKLLGSVYVLCLSKRLTSMEAVIFQLLYALDFQLAEREYGSAKPKS